MSTEFRQNALDYLRENQVCHMATIAGDRPVNRVMHGGRIDDDFTVWFATGLSSNKVGQLAKNPYTCLSFFNGKADVYIHGKGEVLSDQATRDEHWHDELSVMYRDFDTTGFASQEVLK